MTSGVRLEYLDKEEAAGCAPGFFFAEILPPEASTA
jgi:hypothetical protein